VTSTDNNEDLDVLDIAVVALGGGHGLANTLRAARLYAKGITAVVSLGDDGGSSGILREEYAIAPPGDIRRCLSALADRESFLGQHLEHRVVNGVLEGHPVGNLLLAGLTLASDDFEGAVAEVAGLVGAVGTIYPATTVPVTLVAETDQGTVSGQVAVDGAKSIYQLSYVPVDPPVPTGVLRAIAEADQVVLGPGSFFTSVLASASLPAVRQALAMTEAQRVLVANISGSPERVSPLDLSTHMDALAEHGLKIDVVLADSSLDIGKVGDVSVVQAELANSNGTSHDPKRLATVLAEVHLASR